MGNETSAYQSNISLAADAYMPISKSTDIPNPSTRSKSVFKKNLNKFAFFGIWSMYKIYDDAPCPRKGQFTVHDKITNKMYIGYGHDINGEYLRDLWCLDLDTHKWTNIQLSGELDAITPRVSCSACLSHTQNGTFIILFGGYSAPSNYYSQLHYINVETGHVGLIPTNGEEPCPRATPLTALYDGKYYVWGGYGQNKMHSDLHVLDLSTRTWHVFEQDIIGRTAVPSAIVGSKMYTFGNSKQGGVVVIDLENMRVYSEKTTGAEPNSELTDAGMVAVGKFLFFFGGKAGKDFKYGFMFTYDTERKWWFVFYIEPDGDTVSTQDGAVSKEGLFEVPKASGFSIVYNEKERELVETLGEPMGVAELSVVSIGEALGFLNIRDDMVDCFRMTNNL